MASRQRRKVDLRSPSELAAMMAQDQIPVPAEDLAAFEAWVESQIPEGASEEEAAEQRLILNSARPRPITVVCAAGARREELVDLMIKTRSRWTPPDSRVADDINEDCRSPVQDARR